MDTRRTYAKAVPGLFKAVESEQIILFRYAGLSDDGKEALYEVKDARSNVIAEGTREQILEALAGEKKEESHV